MIIVLATFDTKHRAKKIIDRLLRARLIACATLLPVESTFWWKGKIKNTKEVLVLLKARKGSFKVLDHYMRNKSGYETPEVIALSPRDVSLPYKNWLLGETKKPARSQAR